MRQRRINVIADGDRRTQRHGEIVADRADEVLHFARDARRRTRRDRPDPSVDVGIFVVAFVDRPVRDRAHDFAFADLGDAHRHFVGDLRALVG